MPRSPRSRPDVTRNRRNQQKENELEHRYEEQVAAKLDPSSRRVSGWNVSQENKGKVRHTLVFGNKRCG